MKEPQPFLAAMADKNARPAHEEPLVNADLKSYLIHNLNRNLNLRLNDGLECPKLDRHVNRRNNTQLCSGDG